MTEDIAMLDSLHLSPIKMEVRFAYRRRGDWKNDVITLLDNRIPSYLQLDGKWERRIEESKFRVI